MKALINSLKRTHWFKASVVFFTSLLFLVFPSCQKDELEQGTVLNMDGLTYSALSNKDKLRIVKDVNGNWYKTVIIRTQVWMAENLKTTRFNDITKIPLVSEDITWNALSTPGYCWYNNRTTNKTVYGALYNWYAISTGKLCPTDWHVPSDAEWYDLILYFDPSAKLTVMPVYESLMAGNQIKETGTTHWTETDINVTNLSGFTALPEGSRDSYLRKFQIYWNKRLLVEFFSYRAFIYFCVGS